MSVQKKIIRTKKIFVDPAASPIKIKSSKTLRPKKNQSVSNENDQSVSAGKARIASSVVSDAVIVCASDGFQVNEIVVYAKLGVGRIIGIDEKNVCGALVKCFVIESVGKKLIIMLPTARAQSLGLRKLASKSVVAQVYQTLTGRSRIRRMMWARRAQEYEAKIRSGNLVMIAEVVRDLYRSDKNADVSYSERQLCETALLRLAQELASIDGRSDLEARSTIEYVLQKAQADLVSLPKIMS
jgi:CarD family transcriptional regulator